MSILVKPNLLFFKSISHLRALFNLGFLLFYLLTTNNLQAQAPPPDNKGTEFWLSSPLNSNYQKIMISSEEACQVSIKTLVDGTSNTYNLSANSTIEVAVGVSKLWSNVEFSSDLRSVLVTSTKDISLYLIDYDQSDATVIYPSDALPENSRYMLLSHYEAGYPIWDGQKAAIVSHQDSTPITINLKNVSGGNDSVIYLSLDEGEVYRFNGVLVNSEHYDITGSTVQTHSNKKTSVILGSNATYVFNCGPADKLLEQCPPATALGTEYIIPPMATQINGFMVKLVATFDSTIITKDGIVVDTLNRGEFSIYDINTSRVVCIKGSHPILVAQIMKSWGCSGQIAGDPAMVFLNASDNVIYKASIEIAYIWSTYQNFASICVPKDAIDSMIIDGSLIPRSQFTSSGCDDYYYLIVPLSVGKHSFSNPYGFYAYTYTVGGQHSFLYGLGFGVPRMEQDIIAEYFTLCETDSARLYKFEPLDTTLDHYNWFWNDLEGKDTLRTSRILKPFTEYQIGLSYNVAGWEILDTIYYDIYFEDYRPTELILEDSLIICDDSYTIICEDYLGFTPNWNTGDTTYSIETDTSGEYKVTYTDSFGCILADSIYLEVYDKVNAEILVYADNFCLGSDIDLAADIEISDSDTISSYQWYIDRLASSTSEYDSIINPEADNYDILLVVNSVNGCLDSASERITVSDTALIYADISIIDSCYHSNEFVIKNQSVLPFGTLDSTYWMLSTGESGASRNFKHSFDTFGNQYIDIVLTTVQGCSTSRRFPLHVNEGPKEGFIISDSIPCVSSNLFTFQSHEENTSDHVYLWDFDDGSSYSSKQDSISKSYKQAGSYDVVLTVYNSKTQCATSTTKSIAVSNNDPSAIIVTDSFNTCEKGNFIALHNNSDTSDLKTFRWLFNGELLSTNNNLIQSFDSLGTYEIMLAIENNLGCKDSSSKRIQINPTEYADLKIKELNNCGDQGSFCIENLNPLENTRYRWEPGDGSVTLNTDNEFCHTFTGTGSYTIRLITQTFLYACKDTAELHLPFYPEIEPKLVIDSSINCINNNYFSLQDSSNYGGLALKNKWLLNGNLYAEDRANILLAFDSIGAYELILVAPVNSSCEDSSKITLLVKDKSEIKISVNDSAQCLSGNNFEFSIISSKSTSSFRSISWLTSENQNSNTLSPSFNYKVSGIKQISLLTTDEDGCTDSLSTNVVVYEKLRPEIVVNDTKQCLNSAEFILKTGPDSILNKIESSHWHFDNDSMLGDSIRLTAPIDIGKKKIDLVIRHLNGCTDTSSTTIEVIENPMANFIGDSVCEGEQFKLVNLSTPTEIDSYEWLVHDSIESVERDFLGQLKAGAYNAYLKVTHNGCSDSLFLSNVIWVDSSPTAIIDYEILSNNKGILEIQFADSSKNNSTSFWEFSDGQVSTEQHPKIHYTIAGDINVILKAENETGCTDTAMLSISQRFKLDFLIPNAFSPNDDGLNDIFSPVFIGTTKNYELRIFNKWGELLFVSTDPRLGWNGEANGNLCQQDVYLFTLSVNTGYERKDVAGTVTLLR